MNAFWNTFFFCQLLGSVKDVFVNASDVPGERPHMKKKKLAELERLKRRQDRNLAMLLLSLLFFLLVIALIVI